METRDLGEVNAANGLAMVERGTRNRMSRTEFISDNQNLSRGCFVTTKRALALFFLSVASTIVVALIMCYYGPNLKYGDVSTFIIYYN